MSILFKFGESVDGYAVKVLNERAVRAAAGILFLLAIVSFMNAWLMGNFQPTRIFVVAFLIDFVIRIFVNPAYAPSLIVGQFMVRKQAPEYVGAPQKRFAWAIGLLLALAMVYLVVINNVIGPINLIVCATCLLLLFFESAFGICIGCKIYNLFSGARAQLCPGEVCDVEKAPRGQRLGIAHAAVLALFTALVFGTARFVTGAPDDGRSAGSMAAAETPSPTLSSADDRCKVPAFAIALGHEEKWKLHNNCK
jgi:hypothetical protein